MYIKYATRSQFLEACEAGVRKGRAELDGGSTVQIGLKAGGYDAAVTVTINLHDRNVFDSDWERTDPTRFPARIKAAATALLNCGCAGRFEVSHFDGCLKIRTV